MGSRRVGAVRGAIFAKGYTLTEFAERVASAVRRVFTENRLRKLFSGAFKDLKDDEAKAVARLLDLTLEQVRADHEAAVVAWCAKSVRRST